MQHTEYRRIVKGADTAVLFIHGICGTPNHFSHFISLVPDTVSVFNMLLDGHGKGVSDFSRASMKRWEAQVQAAVDELSATHDKIYMAAHSMGTLFSIEQAVRNDKIAGLFLLAAPVILSIKPRMMISSSKVFFDRIRPDDEVAQAAKNCYGIERDMNIFKYLGWIPRYLELFSKIRRTRRLLPLLQTQGTAYQSGKDEVVSVRSIKCLKKNSDIAVVKLEKSSHYYYEKQELEFLLNEFQKFISQV